MRALAPGHHLRVQFSGEPLDICSQWVGTVRCLACVEMGSSNAISKVRNVGGILLL